MERKSNSCFITAPGFCPDCGSILPLLDGKKTLVTCYACKRKWDPESMLQTRYLNLSDYLKFSVTYVTLHKKK